MKQIKSFKPIIPDFDKKILKQTDLATLKIMLKKVGMVSIKERLQKK